MSPIAIFLFISAVQSAQEIFSTSSDPGFAFLLRDTCSNLSENDQKLINGAIWTAHRLDLGLRIYQTCNETDEIETVFDLYRSKTGIVTTSGFPAKVENLIRVLDLGVWKTVKCTLGLVKAVVALLKALKWTDVTVVAPDVLLVDEFWKIAQLDKICVRDFLLYDSVRFLKNASKGNLVVFGEKEFLKSFLKEDEGNMVLVATDGSTVFDLPENSFYLSSSPTFEEEEVYTPNIEIFEIAVPLVTISQTLNNTKKEALDLVQVTNLLKIDPNSLNYYIYKTENSSFPPTKAFTYNFFTETLTHHIEIAENSNASLKTTKCKHLIAKNRVHSDSCEMRIREESWVFAYMSLSLLGILLCLAILIFLLVAICRRKNLEGNPVLTLLLLLTVMLMFFSILPLSLENCNRSVCLTRALSITLSFAAAFSLMLSRSILLAAAAKEIGFMSHVAGPVQSFLCLFIFGVQAALSLQIFNFCQDIFHGFSFVYLLSYNAVLLLLLLCLTPFILKSERNYREGKYFTMAVVCLCTLWCFWIPAYAFLGHFRDFVLCFALVATASVLLGTIFVPRTYLMTIAMAREKMSSSLAGASSAMDIYRTGAQPVYDCVNVAAINAVSVARAGLTLQQPDLYTCPNLPEDLSVCDSPLSDDKVTRF